MFKKKSIPKNLRKRSEGSDEQENDVEKDSDGSKKSLFISKDKTLLPIKETKTNVTGIRGSTFASDRSTSSVQYAGDAFHTNEIDTEEGKDNQSIIQRNSLLKQQEGNKDCKDNVYKGKGAYKTFTGNDNQSIDQVVQSSKLKGTQGPLRAPAFVRSTSVFDYQPDVCKDYKETGFCGFGDSCKFMHDRSDYKSGWQQEKEWEDIQKRKKQKLQDAAIEAAASLSGSNDNITDDISSGSMLKLMENQTNAFANKEEELVTGHYERNYSKGLPSQMEQINGVKSKKRKESSSNINIDNDESLPFACSICRKSFTLPVVTTCGHYFCTSCIMVSNKKSSKCPICKKQMFGVFNTAHKIIAKAAQMHS